MKRYHRSAQRQRPGARARDLDQDRSFRVVVPRRPRLDAGGRAVGTARCGNEAGLAEHDYVSQRQGNVTLVRQGVSGGKPLRRPPHRDHPADLTVSKHAGLCHPHREAARHDHGGAFMLDDLAPQDRGIERVMEHQRSPRQQPGRKR